MTPADGSLAALREAVRDAMGESDLNDAPLPSPTPSNGQSNTQWRTAVEHARTLADARAVRHREIVDRVSSELFGTTVADLLPPVGPLGRRVVHVSTPPDPQLADVLPDTLHRTLPRGPGARVPEHRTSIRVSVTEPADPRAVIIRLHGGAFWMAGGVAADRIDARLIEQLAHVAQAVVLNVDYRLAPEHPFPAAIVDTLSVLDAVRHASLGLPNPGAPIALVGTSSGANIATVAAMADAARRPASALSALGLIVPSVLLARVPSGARAVGDRKRQLRGYLGDLPLDAPWASPAVRSTLPGMPRTFAAIATADEIAVGGEQLCAAIEAGGGVATARHYEMTHTTAPPAVESALILDLAAAMRDALRG